MFKWRNFETSDDGASHYFTTSICILSHLTYITLYLHHFTFISLFLNITFTLHHFIFTPLLLYISLHLHHFTLYITFSLHHYFTFTSLYSYITFTSHHFAINSYMSMSMVAFYELLSIL